MVETKRCPHCVRTKLSAEFNRNGNRRDGLDVYCRDCTREKRKELDARRKKAVDVVPSDRQCGIEGCTNRLKGRGYCDKHLKRLNLHGDPLGGRKRRDEVRRRRRPNGLTLEESFRWFQPGDPPPAGVIWAWNGSVDDKGYGIVRHGGRNVLAHRLSYEIFVGPIPKGLVVRHKNDTPIDVNPHNLELGTLLDNVRDRSSRKRTHAGPRSARGSAAARSRVTEADVPLIRQAYAGGMKQFDLAIRYGVSQGAISQIVNRKNWGHIP